MINATLELLYTVFAITGCFLVMKKKRCGWMIWLVATPIIIAVLIMGERWFLIPAFLIYGYLDWRGWVEWREK